MLRTDQRIRYSAHHEALPYQVDAVEATVDLEYAALFHEQGLGKTKMALDLALRWLAPRTVDSVLVVTKRASLKTGKGKHCATPACGPSF